MSNRLEWRELSTQGINPNEGLRTYMSGLKNAHEATNTMRQNQVVDDQNAIKGQRGLLDSVLKVDEHLQAREQQVIANDFKQQYMDSLNKSKGGAAPAYDKLAFENYVTQHFEQGGNLESLAQDENFGAAFDTTNPKIMEHLLSASGRYSSRLKDEYEADIKLNNDKRDRAIAELPNDLTEDGHKAAVEDINRKFDDARIGLDDYFNRGVSTRSLKQKQQLTGTAPSNRNKDGSVERPSLSRMKDVNARREAVIKDTDQRKAELEQELEAGMSLEDYNTQMEMLESYREENLKQIDDEDSKANIKSVTGATVGVDYSISSSGSLVVGGKNVPERVGNALKKAAELTGQPLDILLPFAGIESAFNPKAVSNTGVAGLMQVTGATADAVYNKNKEAFVRAGLTYDPKDRTNPETSALLGALYIGEIRDKLGNDAPMELVYMAYNLGPNNKLLDPSHNPDTPIDQLVPVSAGKISIGLDKNRGIYQNKDGTWKTLNEAAEVIRGRAGVSDIILSDPAATIEEMATADNRESGLKVPSELSKDTEGPLVNYTPADFLGKTDSTLRAGHQLVDQFIPPSSTGGKDAKPVSELSKGEIKTMLAAAGIEDISDSTATDLFKKITDDSTLRELNSDQIGMLLSWTPKGNFTKDIDGVGLEHNIQFIKTVWKDNERALKMNMDDAILAKKLMSDFKAKADPLKDAIRYSEQVIAETGLKLEDDTLRPQHEAAYNREIDTHRNKKIKNIKALDFHSNYIASEVNPLLNNIARFTKTMEDTYAKEEERLAQLKVEELMRNRTTTDAEINQELDRVTGAYSNSPLPYTNMGVFGDYLGGRTPKKNTENPKQFTGNPFKDYAANKRLAESKNK